MTAATAVKYGPQVTYRAPTQDDVGFIYNSWLKSHRGNSAWARDMPAQVYFSNHKKVLAKLLEGSGILVACNPENTEQIFGYGVYQPTTGGVTVLHYVYVKHPYRRLGIGGDIVQTILRLSGHDMELPAVASHVTGLWSQVLKDKWHMIYNPYVIGAHE